MNINGEKLKDRIDEEIEKIKGLNDDISWGAIGALEEVLDWIKELEE
jgi:hypothetical protein